MNWLEAKINKEFKDRFSFLKLLEVNYRKSTRFCTVIFLYPSNKHLNDDDKKTLLNFIKKQLNLSASLEVKYKKSYLDDDLIQKHFLEIIKLNYPSLHALSEEDNLKITKSFNHISITFDVDENSVEYLNEDNFKTEVKSMLESKFCSDFTITLNKVKSSKELKLIKRDPSVTSEVKTPRYEISILKNIFGGSFLPNPEFIKNIKSEKSSVILSGKIENFEKKSYESKKEKTKRQIKYFYSFVLNDTTGKIGVKYFTTKSNEKKMDNLSDGQEVAILGDVRTFNSVLNLYIKAIATCILPNKIEMPVMISNEFEHIFPEKYTTLTQENLFKKVEAYSKDIYEETFVVFDVETTGLDYETDEILEIGAIKIKNGEIVSKWETLIRPKSPIPLAATKINNITDEMVKNSPTIDIAIRDFYKFSKNSKMLGCNVSFDQKFIQKAAKNIGIFFDNEFIDVMTLARSKLRLTRYKLTNVAKRLDIPLNDAHRALADSLATAKIFLKLNSDDFTG